MDPKLLFSSPKSFPVLLLYCKTPFLENPRICAIPHLPFSSKLPEKTQFMGRNLDLQEGNGSLRKTHLPFHPIRALIRRKKEVPFDSVIQRDKKLKLVMFIRKVLVSRPDRTMSLRELGRFRRHLGLNRSRSRRLITLLRKFPAVFEIMEEGGFSVRFKLTPEAERLYLEELRCRDEMEGVLVTKLRKLLMMSSEKRILLEKIAHLGADLGLPLEFSDTICRRHPQYFKVVTTTRGPMLELTNWDPELAVSVAELIEEENRTGEVEEKNLIVDRPLKFNRVKLPKSLCLSRCNMRRIYEFRDMEYISPYSDFSGLRPNTPEKEKHACGVVHEILSLTVEKRTLVDNITHFREEFGFSQQLKGMLIRHPDMFYVSLKGDKDSVFLREAYHNSHLVEKGSLFLIKEKFRLLVSVPRFLKRASPRGEGDNDGAEATGEQSDGNAEFDVDDDGEYEDNWSDGDYNSPPDFNEADGNVMVESENPIKIYNNLTENEEDLLVPVFPDGCTRERW